MDEEPGRMKAGITVCWPLIVVGTNVKTGAVFGRFGGGVITGDAGLWLTFVVAGDLAPFPVDGTPPGPSFLFVGAG